MLFCFTAYYWAPPIDPRAAKYTVHVEQMWAILRLLFLCYEPMMVIIRTVSSGSLQTYTHLSKPCLGIFQCWCYMPCLSQKLIHL